MGRIMSMKVIDKWPQLIANWEKDDDEHIKTACNELIEVINNPEKALDPSKSNEYSAYQAIYVIVLMMTKVQLSIQ